MARARRAPFNRQGLEFNTASLQRAARLFVQLLLVRLSKKQQPKKVQSRLYFRETNRTAGCYRCGRRTSACGLLRSGVDGRNLDEIRLRSRRGGIVCDVIGKVWLSA